MLVARHHSNLEQNNSGDHLFLLPERALSMDSTQLRQDLANFGLSLNSYTEHESLQFEVARPSLSGRGTVWLSGAVQNNQGDAANKPPEPPQRSSSRARALEKENTLHWFAYVGPAIEKDESILKFDNLNENERDLLFTFGEDRISRPSSRRSSFSQDSELAAKDAAASAAAQKEREERIRTLKEKQSEERIKKLEELKQQALAAQRYREQKEEERRKRIDELRQRDQDRRAQVEERRRLLWEVEREKRDQLIKRTQEREARLEAKRRNERSSIVFAFGSSTPRMLDPETGGIFGGRRATSTTNVMFSGVPLTRRPSERELEGSNNSMSRKQRATSAHALDRKPGEDIRMSSSMYEVFHWDLDKPPIIPVPIPRGRKSPAPRLPSKALSLPPHSPPPPLSPTSGAASVRGEEEGGGTRVRRKTDLIPTIPSSRDTSRHRSPGTKSQSMLNLTTPKPPPRKSNTPTLASRAALSRSTGTLNKHQQQTANLKQEETPLKRASHSMSHLAPVAPPRMTRAERLRQRARQIAQANKEKETGTQRSTTTADNSRPTSAMSGQSTDSPRPQLRPRPPARKPRPSSIAVTGIGVTNDALVKTPVSEKPIIDNSKTAPVPRTRKSSVPKTVNKSKEKLTPKTTPLASPAVEQPPPPPAPIVVIANKKEEIIVNNENEIEKQDEMKPETPPETNMLIIDSTDIDINNKNNDDLIECDMTTSMLAKQRITTEDEAKAALAERRRLAREQAEREAELERQRQEEMARLEEEKLKREEEEHRRQEEETLRLLEEAREAEENRLKQAIEEAKKKEAEEAALREQEAKLRQEKEEQEKRAREEAERLRKEMAEKLKREEEERNERRKRVEAIMSRTRKSGTPSSQQKDNENDGKISPTEGENNNVDQQQQQQSNGHHNVVIQDKLLDLENSKTHNILLDFEPPPPATTQNGASTDLLS